jgi:hypothetical protein
MLTSLCGAVANMLPWGGLSPGSIGEVLAPWLAPMQQALGQLQALPLRQL